jgi:hypothetical protein
VKVKILQEKDSEKKNGKWEIMVEEDRKKKKIRSKEKERRGVEGDAEKCCVLLIKLSLHVTKIFLASFV